MLLRDKTALITGASRGIGLAIAELFAQQGASVILTARSDSVRQLAEQWSASGRAATAVVGDITTDVTVRECVQACRNTHGKLDILVNNAGVMPLAPMADLHVDEWDRMIDVNVRGTLYGIAAVLPRMREQGGGHIVNIASVAGHRVDPTAAVYCATKYAVRALSEGLRQESRDIRVTIISPGFTESELLDRGGAIEAQAAARAAAQQLAIPATAVAEAIGFALDQPPTVDINEIIVRPTVQG